MLIATVTFPPLEPDSLRRRMDISPPQNKAECLDQEYKVLLSEAIVRLLHRLAQSSRTHILWRKIRTTCSAGVNEILSFCLPPSRFAILKFLKVTQLRLPSLHVISALQITINLQEVVFRFINNGWVATPSECLLSASKRIRVSCTEETSWST